LDPTDQLILCVATIAIRFVVRKTDAQDNCWRDTIVVDKKEECDHK
jgi:hypothetical protein